MPQKIKVPKTVSEATAALNGVGQLLTAKEWERAAIVYAFTTVQQGSNQHRRKSDDALGIAEFAALGITGLTNRETVGEYRRAWVENGTLDIKPGDTITLPTMDWPPGQINHRRGSHATEAREYIARNPKVAVEAIKAVPAVADAVTTAIANDDSLSEDVTRKAFAKRTGTTDRGRVAPGMVVPTDLNRDLSDTLSRLGTLLRKEDNGEFTVNGLNESWLRIMGLQLNERATSGKADGDLFDQIDALLASARGAA